MNFIPPHQSNQHKQDRIHEKFMHRETIISREIKLLKNKFEVLEKNRQFKTMLQKSGADSSANDDLNSGLDSSFDEAAHRKRSETGTMLTVSEIDSFGVGAGGGGADGANMDDKLRGLGSSVGAKSVRIKMSNLSGLSQVFSPLLGSLGKRRRGGNGSRSRRKSNKVSSIMTTDAGDSAANELMTAAVNQLQDQSQLASNHSNPAAGAAGESTDSRFVVSSPATKKPSFFGRLFKR